MKQRFLLSISIVTAVLLINDAVEARTLIQNKGSDTLVNVAQAWAEEYRKVKPDVAVSVTGGGSGTGIAALINGTVDLANASRRMKEKEIALAKKRGQNPMEFTGGYDALAVFIHHDNPMKSISVAQLADIYGTGGEIDNWSQLKLQVPGCKGNQIVLVSQQSYSGTYTYFRNAILGNKRDYKLGTLNIHGSKDVIDLVEKTPCAIGFSGLAYTTDNVKVACVANKKGDACVNPSIANVYDGSYPIARPLFMYTNGEPKGEVKKYMDWILSDEGQCVILKKGYAPVRAVTCNGRPKRGELSELRFNVWAESATADNEGQPSFKSLKLLTAKRNEELKFRVFLDLAAFLYSDESSGVISAELSKKLQDEVKEWLKNRGKEFRLRVLTIPDPTVFKISGPPTPRDLAVDLDAINGFLQKGVTKPKDVVTDLKETAPNRPEYVFGRAEFELTTKANFPIKDDKPSWTSVTLVFSKDDKPLGELVVPLCIGLPGSKREDCGTRELQFTLKGNEAIRLGTERGIRRPDAALNLVPTEGPMMVLLWINDPTNVGADGYYLWPLDVENTENAIIRLKRTVNDLAKLVDMNPASMATIGDSLWGFLFPPDQVFQSHEAFFVSSKNAGKAALEKFLSKKPILTVASDGKTGEELIRKSPDAATQIRPEKVLFVRTVQGPRHDPLFLPVGILPIRDGEKPLDFAGFRVRIETAVYNQSYAGGGSCINRWISALPAVDSRDHVLDEVAREMRNDQVFGIFSTGSTLERYSTIQTLKDWFFEEKQSDSLVFIAISHHGPDVLSYDRGEGVPLTVNHARRTFKSPSVAILNGCSTGEVGATGIVRRLNWSGVHSFIATNAGVQPETAADFATCFVNVLKEQQSKADYTLSHAYFDTLTCLKEGSHDKVDAHGTRALKYMLLGNGNVRLCLPST